jgi:hypothetical protein
MKHIVWCSTFALTLFVAGSSQGGGKGTEVTLDNLKSTAPANWKSQPPSNKFRAYQFLVPGASDKDSAELVIFYFGAGSGGSVEDNINRWKGTFQAPQGKTIDQVSKVEKKKIAGAELTYLDIHGTFLSKNPPFDPNAKSERRENYRRFGVFFDSKNGPYFITLTGPAATLEREKKAFDSWLESFK